MNIGKRKFMCKSTPNNYTSTTLKRTKGLHSRLGLSRFHPETKLRYKRDKQAQKLSNLCLAKTMTPASQPQRKEIPPRTG